ncbi:MAG: DUF1648 domain-containing protein [Eudoraea sp.]|nr:DUF1648 domain-containing protein [Eudoraea sp.]
MLLALLMSFLFPAIYYATLPDQIPIHFNASGLADSYGEKSMVWFLPILGSLMCFGLYKLRKNFRKLNPRGTERENKISTMGLLISGFLVALSFAYINIQMVRIALGKSENLGTWFLPLFIAAFLILPFLPILKFRKRR